MKLLLTMNQSFGIEQLNNQNNIDMIQENINQKFNSLGVLLLLDCPAGIQLGIDNISWKIGSKFKGIKLIPLGTHIVTYSLESENHMFKIAKFLIFSAENRILVFKWNDSICQFSEVRGEQAEGYVTGVKHYHFDAHLGPYPTSNLAFWSQNTKYITKQVLQRLDPIEKLYQFEHEYGRNKERNPNNTLAIDEDQNEQMGLQSQQNVEEMEEEKQNQRGGFGKFEVLSDTIYYTQIPRFLTGDPSSITRVNMDKTQILKKIIQKDCKNKQDLFLGQLQYSFISFILAENQESLEQWKKIVDLLVFSQSSYLAVQGPSKDMDLEKLAMDFIPVFYDQLNQFPIDFFRDEISKGSFLCGVMKQLQMYSKGGEYSLKVRKRIKKLLDFLETKFQYIVDSSQDEEYKPVLVKQNQFYY